MRPIKFRAWDEKNYLWVTDCFIGADGRAYRFDKDGAFVCPKLIPCLSTGLLDSQGVEIYEGDICRYEDPEEQSSFLIVWRESSYRKEYGNSAEWDKTIDLPILTRWDIDHLNILVAGNIHQNPELLK